MPQSIKKKLKPSSRSWVARQLKDPFVQKARQEGYRARSAYKLLDIDKKYKILRGKSFLDLGSAPGGWLQVMQKKNPSATIIGIDILPIEPLQGIITLTADFTSDEGQKLVLDNLRQQTKQEKFDGILSDMAMNTIGHASTDHLRTLRLAESALTFASQHLCKNGFFLCKVFQGGASQAMLATIKQQFSSVVHIKPDASRKESPEVYLLARGFKGKT